MSPKTTPVAASGSASADEARAPLLSDDLTCIKARDETPETR